MRVMFIQYGDFREAYNNFKKGNSETYKAQRYSVDYVVNLAKELRCETSVLCVNALERYNEKVNDRLSVAGILNEDVKTGYLLDVVRAFEPTHLVLRTPIHAVLKYAVYNAVHILPLFADYFTRKNIIQWYRNKKLVHILNNQAIPIISNHNIPACESLANIGVNKAKIVPWDWPQKLPLDDCSVRKFPSKNVKLLYVGAVSEDKGTFDCLAAMTVINKSKFSYSLKIIGPGKIAEATLYKAENNLVNVDILGVIANENVLKEMREADVVIVPSRHQYPEGMPNTIYEALSMRTPLILSDHPVFVARFNDKEDVMFFKASDPESLAKSIQYLSEHPATYSSLSEKSHSLLSKLEMPLKWGELISTWLRGGNDIDGLRSKYSLQ